MLGTILDGDLSSTSTTPTLSYIGERVLFQFKIGPNFPLTDQSGPDDASRVIIQHGVRLVSG